MSDFLSLLFDSGQGNTVLIYILLFVFGSLLAFMSQNKCKFNKFWFVADFLLLWFFYAFNDVGIDTEHYKYYFQQYAQFIDCGAGGGAVELLYQYLNVFLHLFTSSPDIAVAIVRTIQLSLFFYAVYLMRDRVRIGYAVMAYVAFFYLDSFNLLRSSLAGSLCLLSFVWLYNKKYLISVVSALLAVGFHNSSLIYFGVLMMFFIINHKALAKRKLLLSILAIVVLAIVVNYGNSFIVGQITENDLGEGRYDNYVYGTSSAGLFVFLKYTPVFIILLLLAKKSSETEPRWWFMNFVWATASFTLALLGYQIGIITRVAIMFSQAYIFFIPYYMKIRSTPSVKKTAFLGPLCGPVMILFYIIMFVFTTASLYVPSGLNNFKFYWQ